MGPHHIPEPEHLLGVEQLARCLLKSRRAIYHLRERGVLPPPIKIGNALRWRLADIEDWLEENREGGGR